MHVRHATYAIAIAAADSILLRVRAPQVLDSLQRANYDTAAIRTVRTQVNFLTNPNAAAQGVGGRGGGGGGRGAGGGQDCYHPTTQWGQFWPSG